MIVVSYHYLSNWNDTYKILPRINYDRNQIKWENDKSVVIIGSYPEFTVEEQDGFNYLMEADRETV